MKHANEREKYKAFDDQYYRSIFARESRKICQKDCMFFSQKSTAFFAQGMKTSNFKRIIFKLVPGSYFEGFAIKMFACRGFFFLT